MSIKEKILSVIKQSNPAALNLTVNDIVLSNIVILNGDARNTQITVSASSTGYSGSVNVKYNRKNLNSLGANLTFYKETAFNQQFIIDKINETCNTGFTINDFLPFTTVNNNTGKVERVTLTASPTNYEWFGTIVIATIRGNNNQASNESVLFAIAELDSKFEHFFEVTEIVNSIAGHSGNVTKEMLGIDLIDNTPDLLKPISDPVRLVLDEKLDNNSIYLIRSNVSNDDLTLGTPVYAVSNLVIDKANASAADKLSVIGLTADNLILSQNGIGRVQTTGIISGTIEQWHLVTGMVGGLLSGRKYFLDKLSGKLTPFLPEDAIAVCPLGKAISQTEFSINIETIINL